MRQDVGIGPIAAAFVPVAQVVALGIESPPIADWQCVDLRELLLQRWPVRLKLAGLIVRSAAAAVERLISPGSVVAAASAASGTLGGLGPEPEPER